MKGIPCDLCGSEDFFPFLKKEGRRIVKCKTCGLVCVNPQPRDFSRRYFEGLSSPFEYYFKNVEADRKTFNFTLDKITPFIRGNENPSAASSAGGKCSESFTRRKILDIGCATGVFMEVARERSFEVDGTELNPMCVDYCERKKLKVSSGGIETFSGYSRKYDFIHMGDVIEHLSSPLSILRKANSLLEPNGFILISTPNINSFAARIFQVKPEEHLFYFSMNTLKRILLKADFKPIFIERFDRWRDMGSLGFSSTFHGWRWVREILQIVNQNVSRNLCIRFPFFENLLALAKRQ